MLINFFLAHTNTFFSDGDGVPFSATNHSIERIELGGGSLFTIIKRYQFFFFFCFNWNSTIKSATADIFF